MKYWIWIPVALVMGLVGYEAASVLRQPASPMQERPDLKDPPPSVAETLPQPRAVTLETLLADLGDAGRKPDAVRFLAQVPYQKRDRLLQMMQRAGTDEIQQLLAARIDAIQLQLVQNPPPISLHVTNATLDEVVTALNEEMGTQIRYESFGNRAGTYSLDVKEKPFWDVIFLLHQQRSFRVLSSNGFTLGEADEGMENHAVSGAFLFYVNPRNFTFVNKPMIQLMYTFAADPRVEALNYRMIRTPAAGAGSSVTVGPDSEGNVLAVGATSGNSTGFTATNVYVQSLDYNWPEKPGGTLSWMRATPTVVVATADERAEVDGIEQLPNWNAKLAGSTIDMNPTVDTLGHKVIQFKVDSTITGPQAVFQILDASGQIRWGAVTGTGFGSRTTNFPMPPQLAAPYNLKVRVPRAMVEFAPVFEVRDIRLPVKP